MNPYWGRMYLYCYPMQPCLIELVNCVSKANAEWKSIMRRLWGEHVAWTRSAVSSLVFESPDASVVVARLLRNTTDMGCVLEPYYGQRVAHLYSRLLAEHITLVGDLIKATSEGSVEKAAEIEKKWFRNGAEIATFLSRINPYIPAEEIREMFDEHLLFIKQGMTNMFNKDFEASILIFDDMEMEAMDMADELAEAVIKQFSYMFI